MAQYQILGYHNFMRHVKPKASRDNGAEFFVLAMGFRGYEACWPEFGQ